MIERLGITAAWLALALLQGCAAAGRATPLDARIDNALARGQQAVQRDDWRDADSAFAQAQQLALSVDDRRRWAQASLNRSWITQRRGQPDAALLQQITEDPAVPAALRLQASQRLVASALRQGASSEADALLAALPAEVQNAPMTRGLKARLAEAQGQPAQAAAIATSLLTGSVPLAEQGNAHRLLARLALSRQQWREALGHAQAAETIDSASQDSEALLDSLKLLAQAQAGLGDAATAAALAQRQAAITQAYCARFIEWGPSRCRRGSPDQDARR